MAHDERLELSAGDRLVLRFAGPPGRPTTRRRTLGGLTEAIRAIDPASTRRVTLHGDPLRHPDLDAVLAACRAHGLSNVTIETDGAPLALPGTVERLVAGGVHTLMVVVGGMRRKVYEAVMRDDALATALEGLRVATRTEGLDVYVVVPLVTWNADDVLPLLDYLVTSGTKPTGFLLYPPEARDLSSSLRPVLLSHGVQAKLAARVFSECARHRIEYGFFQKRGLLPCATAGALDRHGTVFVERLNTMKRRSDDATDTFERVPQCTTCSLEQTCPGVDSAYLATFGTSEILPVPLDVSMDWKLKPIHRLDERGLKSISAFSHDPDGATGRSLLRVNGHCNMSCAFCFIDRTVPDVETETLLRAIDGLATGQLDQIVLSGGEPTLHPDLPKLVAHAKTRGFRVIEMQSNGVKAADPEYARVLVEAGLNKVTVSLHSVDPETSDEITRLPKAFGKTVKALHNFRELGIETQVAHVITKRNFAELPATVRYLREEFPPGAGSLSICFGIAQPISDLVYTWVMPRFDEVRPFMREALDYCLENDLGFGGMIGQGGYPPCMLDGDLRYYEHNLGNVYTSDGGDDFHKPDRCRECSFDEWCLGVRKYYVETHGDAEVKPFRADVAALAGDRAAPRFRPRPSGDLVQIRRRA